jgi:preprotein translocase subunit SecY
MIKTIKSIWLNKSIKKKIIATLLLILVYKLLSVIPVYGVNADTLSSVMAKNA